MWNPKLRVVGNHIQKLKNFIIDALEIKLILDITTGVVKY